MTKARDIARAGTALSSVDATELGYLDGVTSNVQTQINAKQAVVSGVDSTEIGYLDGVTSAIQTQLNAKVSTAGGSTIAVASGTTVPLTITNDGTGNSLVINDVTSDTSPFVVDASGNTGIGTSAMTGKLNVTGSSGGTSAYFTDAVNSSLVVNNLAGGVTLGTDSGGAIHLATNGAAAGNRRLSVDNTGATTVSYTTTTGGAVRNIYMSTSTPSGGSDGDVWIQYT